MSGIDIAIIVIMGLFCIMIFTYISSISGKVDDFMDKINDMEKDIHDFEKRIRKEGDDIKEIKEFVRCNIFKINKGLDDTAFAQNYKLRDIEIRINKIEKAVKAIEEYDSKESKELMTNDEVFELLFDMDAKKARELCCSVKENDDFNEWRNKENKNTKMIKKKYIRGN